MRQPLQHSGAAVQTAIGRPARTRWNQREAILVEGAGQVLVGRRGPRADAASFGSTGIQGQAGRQWVLGGAAAAAASSQRKWGEPAAAHVALPGGEAERAGSRAGSAAQNLAATVLTKAPRRELLQQWRSFVADTWMPICSSS